jgi:DNA-3-methyladenine glycosylase II
MIDKRPPPSLTSSSLLRGVRTLCARDGRLAGVVHRFGPPPLWARRPGYATLVRIILEQQVSQASARAAYDRLQRAAGRVTPRRVAALSETRLRRAGLTRQKAAYCRSLAACIVEQKLTLNDVSQLDDDAARTRLVQVPGIGPWTADIYLLIALGRPDVWPDGDLALARSAHQVKRLRQCPTQAKLRRLATAWAPWRAVAARILWHAYLSNRRQAADDQPLPDR